jgi:ABC-type uncharacterized transport system auxiliary subunit
MWIKKNLIQALITSLMIFASLTGCTTFRERFENQPYRVKQQDQAGSVHMAVVNVVP